MKKSTAELIIAQYEKYGEVFNQIIEISYDIDDPEVRKGIRRAAAEAQAALYEGLVQTVVKLFPDLDPHSSEDDG